MSDSAPGPSWAPGYDTSDVLKQGRRAVIVRATRATSGADVVLKVLAADAGRNELDRLRTLGGVSGVVPLLDAGTTTAGDMFVVLPHYPDGSFADMLSRVGPAPIQEAAAVARSISVALGAMHARGLTHNDVTPGNVLRAGRTPVLTGFGFVMPVGQAFSPPEASEEVFLHSPPEALRGEARTPASDVYQLASTIWTMLTGQPPFSSTDGGPFDPHAYANRVLGEAPRPIGRQDVSRKLRGVLTRALAKRPEERYANAAEFSAAFEQARTSRPATTMSGSNTPITGGNAPLSGPNEPVRDPSGGHPPLSGTNAAFSGPNTPLSGPNTAFSGPNPPLSGPNASLNHPTGGHSPQGGATGGHAAFSGPHPSLSGSTGGNSPITGGNASFGSGTGTSATGGHAPFSGPNPAFGGPEVPSFGEHRGPAEPTHQERPQEPASGPQRPFQAPEHPAAPPSPVEEPPTGSWFPPDPPASEERSLRSETPARLQTSTSLRFPNRPLPTPEERERHGAVPERESPNTTAEIAMARLRGEEISPRVAWARLEGWTGGAEDSRLPVDEVVEEKREGSDPVWDAPDPTSGRQPRWREHLHIAVTVCGILLVTSVASAFAATSSSGPVVAAAEEDEETETAEGAEGEEAETPAVTAEPSPLPSVDPPTDVALDDTLSGVTLTWTDRTGGTGSYFVLGGQQGHDLMTLARTGPGAVTAQVNTENTVAEYCFVVVAVEGGSAPADEVCTSRAAERAEAERRAEEEAAAEAEEEEAEEEEEEDAQPSDAPSPSSED
ncbi:protein kinase [Nocardiopsis alba]|uniref:serine/threonine protein kinase n=1 Tax=Nocardiopsis alba TaxID=53437 RepID=UPI0033D0543E